MCVHACKKSTWFPRNEIELFIHKLMLLGAETFSLILSQTVPSYALFPVFSFLFFFFTFFYFFNNSKQKPDEVYALRPAFLVSQSTVSLIKFFTRNGSDRPKGVPVIEIMILPSIYKRFLSFVRSRHCTFNVKARAPASVVAHSAFQTSNDRKI